ncbi:hypothetical protein Vadar_033214 [Vaccinium darrowii]|uniref:Uncharacterized protein n=1 Tax=Vaccinium darrowii TaxID=229202 RepID=A0ACB7XEF9_9ERIC|nr:hypothetical protein Vadar_033214 [Vaccinium darrowii]
MPEIKETKPGSKEEDDEVDRTRNDIDDGVDKKNQSGVDKQAIVVEQRKEAEVIMKAASSVPMQNKSVNLEEDEALLEEDSSSTHGLDSLVEDSGGPIREICGNKPLIQQITQDTEAQSEERSEEVAQQRVVEETCMDYEENQKELEEKILLLDGPVVPGSTNNIRASQFPSIDLQVELNPIVARKALRARISESCGSASDENITGPSASQGFNPLHVCMHIEKCNPTSPAASMAANHSSEKGTALMGGFITRLFCFPPSPDFLLQ